MAHRGQHALGAVVVSWSWSVSGSTVTASSCTGHVGGRSALSHWAAVSGFIAHHVHPEAHGVTRLTNSDDDPTSFTPVRNEADLIRSRGQPVSFLVRLCNETGGVLLTQG